MMDNLTQQKDEIEALSSIYGTDWKIENESDCCFSIQVSSDVKLFLSLNKEYPSESPPTYQLFAPALNRAVKEKIKYAFEEVYLENIGGPILFQWIERLREVLFEINYEQNAINNDSSVTDVELNVSGEKSDKDIKLNVIHGVPIVDRKSTFQGHACQITGQNDIRVVLDYLLQNKKIAHATHNILAYRIKTSSGSIAQDCDDDGESHAGGRLLHLLQILDAINVVVVVSRWYGGIHLGPDRFRHINNAARQVLIQAEFIKPDK